MATFASRITDLTAAIAAAVNARSGRVGASVYDLAVINGFVGTQAQWLAQNPTGTVFATPAALNAAVGNYVEGAVVGLAPVTTANGKILQSTWRKQGTWWVPFGELKCLNAATLTDIKGWTIGGGPYQGLSFDPRYTKALVIRDGANANKGWDEYIWIGPTTGFFQWTGLLSGGTWQNGAFDQSQAGSTFIAQGEIVALSLHGKTGTAGIGQYTAVAALPPGTAYTPNILQFFGGGVGVWTSTTFYADNGTQTIRPLSMAIPANTEFGCSGTYRRIVPTV